MKLTGAHANFLLHIASGRTPTGVPVPYDKAQEVDAFQLELLGLVERHHVGADKRGACLTPAGAEAFAAILKTMK